MICISFTACEQTIDLPLPDYDEKLVMLGILENDSTPVVYITESVDYFQYLDRRDFYEFVENANVVLNDGTNDIVLELDTVELNLNYIWDYYGYGYGYTVDTVPILGYTADVLVEKDKNYSIQVTEGDRNMSASATVPGSVDVTGISFSRDTIVENYFGYTYQYVQDVLQIKVEDDPLIRDAYKIDIVMGYWDPYVYGYGSNDSTFIQQSFNYSDVNYTKDTELARDGSDLIIEFPIYLPYNEPWRYEEAVNKKYVFNITLERTNLEVANYFQSLFDQWDSEDNPFQEPTPARSNVEGGIGVFGGSSWSGPFEFELICCE